MTTLAARGSGTPATTGTTWATTTNAVDGAAGTNPATYTTLTSTTSGAVATIEVTGYGFSSSIASTDTLNSVTVNLRHFENNTGRFTSVVMQPFDGATAIGTAFTCTLAAAARNDSTTFPVTLAQIRSSTFKVRVTITGAASTQSRIESIDYVDVTADYTIAPPAITQAAYRFYADGTETAATALAAQDTAYTADTSGGDVNLQVRTRLQSTTAIAVPTTDDFQLQWEKNTSGTWADVAADSLADSYPSSNADGVIGLNVAGGGVGQSFLGNGQTLVRVGFFMYKSGAPTATLTAYLYAHTGTFGALSGLPTGSPLATSTTTVAASSLPTSLGTAVWTYFDFTRTSTLTNGTPYVVTVGPSVTDATNRALVGADNTSGTHPGRGASYDGAVWGATSDVSFEVYTGPATVPTTAVSYVSANLTDGAATTNRLGAGSGSFVAGEVSETGLVTDLGWTANNYTELLYSVTLKSPVAPTMSDGYPAANSSGANGLTVATSSATQSFMATGGSLTRVGFLLNKSGTVAGNVTAYLYSHSGTFGTSSSGNGSTLLATSTTSITATSLSTTNTMTYFDFDGTYSLTASTPYIVMVAIDTSTGGGGNSIGVAWDSTTPTHAGNAAIYNGSTWSTFSGAGDLIFEVYTTTEPGLAPADTVRFRVLRNGATTNMTYTATPTITIGSGGPAPVTLAGTSDGTSSTTAATIIARALIASSVGLSTTTAATAVARALAGTADGTSTTTGTLTTAAAVAVALAATSDGTSTVTAAAVVTRGLAATAAGTSTTAAAIARAVPFAATADGTSTTTAAVAAARALAATSTGTSTTTGTLAPVAQPLTAASTGTSSTAGTVVVARAFTATAAGTSTTVGALAGARPLAATSDGTSTTTGATVVARALAGTSTGTSGADGSFGGAIRALAGTSDGAAGRGVAITATLLEPFDNLTAWTTVGTPTIVAGRTGTAVQVLAADEIRYTIPAISESATLTLGFAINCATPLATRSMIFLRSDTGATSHLAVQILNTGAMTILRGGATPITSGAAAGTIVAGTWQYVEIQAVLSDTVGAVTVRVGGAVVMTADTSTDTKNAGTKTTFDQLRFNGNGASIYTRYDDLYVDMGPASTFKGDISLPLVTGGGPILGALSVARALTGSSVGLAATSGALAAARALAATSDGASTVGATRVDVARALTATGTGTSTTAAALTVTAAAGIAATSTGTSTAVAVLAVAVRLTAITAGLTATTGTLTVTVAAGLMKIWTGTVFATAPVKTWNGTSYTAATAVKTFNGTSFV